MRFYNGKLKIEADGDLVDFNGNPIVGGDPLLTGKTLQRGNTFSEVLNFNFDETYYLRGTQTGIINFSVGVNNRGVNTWVYTEISTNGLAINFPETWTMIRNDYTADSSNYGLIVYCFGTNLYQYLFFLIN